MAQNSDIVIAEFRKLCKKKNVCEILQCLHEGFPEESRPDRTALRCILWPVPTIWDLEILAGFIKSRQIHNIFSIGCGTGLLEWLLLQVSNETLPTDDDVNDLGQTTVSESVAYSDTPSFTPEHGDEFPKNDFDIKVSGETVFDSVEKVTMTGVEIDSQWWNSKYAPPQFIPLVFANEDFHLQETFGAGQDLMMLSYFNNLRSFQKYLELFQGTYVLIIGPTQKQFCAPNPLDLKMNPLLPTSDWNMILYQRFGLESVDYVAIYSRVERIESISEEPYFGSTSFMSNT